MMELSQRLSTYAEAQGVLPVERATLLEAAAVVCRVEARNDGGTAVARRRARQAGDEARGLATEASGGAAGRAPADKDADDVEASITGGINHTLALIAALVQGDRYLNADACAVFLGLVTPKGRPNRRGFLDRLACRGSFPKPLVIGNEKKWKKSEVERWADDERKIAQR